VSLDLRARADSDDEAIGDEQRAIFQNSDIGKRSATTGSAAAQG
jgi:hypothetical protein